MNKYSKVGIVCCSNGQSQSNKEKVDYLEQVLKELGIQPVLSDYIYGKEDVRSGTARERAQALMEFYQSEDIQAIFDISGGDMANEVLPYLDYECIRSSNKQFWGYSDLTTIINAIYAKTGKSSVLYQVRNLIYDDAINQTKNFYSTVIENTEALYTFDHEFIQGEAVEGIVVGGNIRCLLKLAGTPYWPDMQDKILLLEAYSGVMPQMTTHLSQLQQIGVFDQVKGVLLGTFTKMEEQECKPSIEEMVKTYVGDERPIVVTKEIGHGTNSKAIVIGEMIQLSR